MSELERLFEPSEDAWKTPKLNDPGSGAARSLRERVGADGADPDQMHNARLPHSAPDVPASTSTGVGLRTSDSGELSAGVSEPSVDLLALVGSAGGRSDYSGWGTPELARAGQRPSSPRQKLDAVNHLSVAVAVLAILMLVGAGAFAFIQRSFANPADEAMVSLGEREAELANETKQAQIASELYVASREEAAASAIAAADVLARLDGRIEAAPLNAARAAHTALEQAASQPVDVSVPAYTRAAIDEESLEQVAHAIDAVRRFRDSLGERVADVRDARSVVIAARAAFDKSLGDVEAALGAVALAQLAAETAADVALRDAVSTSMSRLRDVRGAGGDGLVEIGDLVSALDALAEENERALAEQREVTERPTPVPAVPRYSLPDGSGSVGPSQAATPEATSPSAEPAPQPEPSPSSSSPGDVGISPGDVEAG